MSIFAVDDVVTTAKVRQKILTVDTGANLALLTTYAGMLAFCTTTGGGFTAGRLYQRNEGNTAWYEIADLTSAQSLTNKTISGASNTITNLPTAAFLDGAITVAKLASAITKMAVATSSSTVTVGGPSLADVTGMTVTITAQGNKAGLLTSFSGSMKNSSTTNPLTAGIYDGANSAKHEYSYQVANVDRPTHLIATEAAPSAGSLTRKIRATSGHSSQTLTFNGRGSTNGLVLMVMEIL